MDGYYASCDRCAATAIRWAGADDDFNMGPCTSQLSYCKNSDKWKEIGKSKSIKKEDLQPGDVFITDGHITLYVGEDAVLKKFKDAKGYDDVNGSYGQHCSSLREIEWYMKSDSRVYTIFRNVKSETNSKYKNVGE